METAKLKKFAQFARRSLIEQVSAKLNLVMADGSAARREQPKAIAELEKQLQEHNREQVIERIAYTWFNRFCALRFMDVNRYTRIGVVSPAEGQFQPEILAEAKMGHIDEEMVSEKIRQQIFALLAGLYPVAIRSLRPIACLWLQPVTISTGRCPTFSSALLISPNF